MRASFASACLHLRGGQVAAHELRNGFLLLAHAARRVEAVADQRRVKAPVAFIVSLQAVLAVHIHALNHSAEHQMRAASFGHHRSVLADLAQQEPAICDVADRALQAVELAVQTSLRAWFHLVRLRTASEIPLDRQLGETRELVFLQTVDRLVVAPRAL